MADVPSTREYLNSLSNADATAFLDYIRMKGLASAVYNTPVPYELPCYQTVDDRTKDGAWWADHVACNCLQRGPGSSTLDWSSGYPRFQLKFGSKRVSGGQTFVNTPAKTGIGADVKRLLSAEAWKGLKRIADTAGGNRFTFQVHHLAYTARRLKAADPDMFPLLPSDLGTGSAVAHLCDNHSCCKEEHLQVKPQSVNMSMQRCVGATLLVRDGVILQVHHCPHYVEQVDGVVVQPDCAKVSVVHVGPVFQVAAEYQERFAAAAARFSELLQRQREDDEGVINEDEDDDFM